MRLKPNHEATIQGGARCRHYSCDLGWMVAVVVDDEHAVHFAMAFEPALGTVEAGQSRRHSIELETDTFTNGYGGEGVLQVVTARNSQRTSCPEATQSFSRVSSTSG